jgi:chromosome segregation ATPase
MFVRSLNIILAAMVFVMAVFSFSFYCQQRSSTKVLKTAIGELKEALNEQGVEFEKLRQENVPIKALIPQTKDSIAELKSVISQSRVDAFVIKEDVKQWQKDYVAVLLELEERLDLVENGLKTCQEKLPEGDWEQLQQDVRSLKDGMEKISPPVSAQGILKPGLS